MPKVLRIINRFNLGGPTFNAAYLTKYLEPDFETLLIGGSKEETEDGSEFILEQLGLSPNYVDHMQRELSLKHDRKAYRKLKEIIQDFKPDIVHTHASKAGTLGRLAAHKMKVPIIVHTFHGHVFHSYFGKAKTVFYKNVERYLAKKTTKIVAISDIQKQELSSIHKIAPADKFEIIPLGFNLTKFTESQPSKRVAFRARYHIDNDDIVIAIIGRLVPIKNHVFFIDAFNQLLNRTKKSVRAIIVGDGELKASLQEHCKAIGLKFSTGEHPPNGAKLTFTSWIKTVDDVTAGADIIALSSLNEGTPVTLIEAQAASKPIVSTSVGGIADIVLKDETALLCDSGDLNTYTDNLFKLVENDELRARLSKRGQEFALSKFNFMRLANDVKGLYHQLLNDSK